MHRCRIFHELGGIWFQIMLLECSPGCKGSEQKGWGGDRARVALELFAPSGDGGKEEKKGIAGVGWWYPGGFSQWRGRGVQGNIAGCLCNSKVLVVLLIPQGADLSLSCLNLPGIHAQIPGLCRLLNQLNLVKKSMAVSSLWINNCNSCGHKLFFFPAKKAPLDIQPLVVKQRLVSFPVNKSRLFFSWTRLFGALHHHAWSCVKAGWR